MIKHLLAGAALCAVSSVSFVPLAAAQESAVTIPQATGIFAQRSTLPFQAPDFTRITDAATSSRTCIAPRTRLGFMLPDEQALPAETEMPARSSCTSWLALATPGMA